MRYRNPVRGAASVVVIGVDNNGMGLIRECLGTEAVLPTQSTPYSEAIQIVQKTRPNVVIMGFDIDYNAAVRLGAELQAEQAGLQLVAISEQTDPERIRSAWRAGYREYVVLPDDAPLLRQAVHDAAYGPEQSEELGELVAVIGAKGGIGATLLATNLSAEMSALHRVCLIDLNFSMGDAAAFLDLQPNTSIRDLLDNLHRMDARMLKGSMVIHPPSKLHLLAQPTELAYGEEIRSEDIVRILATTAEAYQYVVADCGSSINPATVTTVAAADRVLVVCSPTVVSVKNTWRRLQLMQQQNVDKDAIRLVLNRWEKGAEVSDQDIEANLKIPIAARIHRDDATCNEAVTYGRLLRDVKKQSPIVADLNAAMSLITDGVTQVTPQTGSRRPFGWLFG